MLPCPNRDGFVKAASAMGTHGLPLTYHRCPHCRGTWAAGYAINFLTEIREDQKPIGRVHMPVFTPVCPECNKPLRRPRADNIPPQVSLWQCPQRHGYFFPAGELVKFKDAQTAKLSYHKLWNIPLPSVTSVLLTSVAVILFTGLAASFWGIRHKQTMESQAQDILVSQRALVTTQNAVVFFIQTRIPTTVNLHIPTWNNYERAMESTDGLTHTITVSALPAATYDYSFTMEQNGQTAKTEDFYVVIP